MADRLIIRGAREHNLRDVNLDLPRDAMIVFTGLSGSGKSSLAFDTIFAEGQRRYVESLSSYARQFLGQMDKPDVDFIEGLSPAVSIDQKSTSRNPRSTVGTITEVYDYLRLLFARTGVPHCPVCGERISKQSPQQIVDRVLAMAEGTRFMVLAPVVRGRKGEYVDLFAELQSKGYARARVDGVVHPLTEPPKLKKQEKHTIEVVVDRLSVKASSKQRLTDSVESALGLSGGMVLLDFVDLAEDDPARERRFSEHLACPNDHPLAIEDLEPRVFSFNAPYGACPECTGLGTKKEVDPELIVPDEERSIREGAIQPWSGGTTLEYFLRLLEALADAEKFSVDTPWRKLPARAQKTILYGVGGPGPRPVPQQVRPRALVLHRLRGRGAVDRAPAQRHRERLVPRQVRGLHARHPVPGLRRRAAQAGGAGGDHRRPQHRRGLQPVGGRVRRAAGHHRARRPAEDDRRAGAQGDQRPAAVPGRRRAWTTCRWTAAPAPSPAARRSASGWPPRSAPAWSACSTCWTSRPSACTSGTTTG